MEIFKSFLLKELQGDVKIRSIWQCTSSLLGDLPKRATKVGNDGARELPVASLRLKLRYLEMNIVYMLLQPKPWLFLRTLALKGIVEL